MITCPNGNCEIFVTWPNDIILQNSLFTASGGDLKLTSRPTTLPMKHAINNPINKTTPLKS